MDSLCKFNICDVKEFDIKEFDIKEFNELLYKNNWDDINNFFIGCCNHGNLKDIKYMIECGVDPHVYNDEAFVRSCQSDNLSVAKYLLEEHNVNINAQNGQSVTYAVPQMVKILLENGVDITNEIIMNRIWVADLDCVPVIKLFVEYGIDQERIAKIFLKMILHTNSLKAHLDVLKFLSNCGTDFNQVIQQIVKE
jgi:hypothetical protein